MWNDSPTSSKTGDNYEVQILLAGRSRLRGTWMLNEYRESSHQYR